MPSTLTIARSRGAARDPRGVHVGLAEHRDGVGQVALDERGGHRSVLVDDEVAERLEPGAHRRRADHVQRARLGVDEDHAISSVRSSWLPSGSGAS